MKTTSRIAGSIALLMILFACIGVRAGEKKAKGYDVRILQNRSSEITLEFSLGEFSLENVSFKDADFTRILFGGSVVTKKKGWAELPFMSASLQLSPDRNVMVEIIAEEYEEVHPDHQLLPSRGIIYRNQDPSSIPYEVDPASIVDAWYPDNRVEASEPYILRDVRGENIYVYPFIYNAARNILRVYTSVTLRVYENHTDPVNPLPPDGRGATKEMAAIYKSLFLNYNTSPDRWTNEIDEYGEILVIYTSRDATVIQPWITWKKEMGFTVYEEQVSTGTNVKTTIQNQYSSNPGILYVQLTGDWADIKSDLGTSQNAPMDPMLGCVVGGDNYHDLIVGRYSASTTTHVTTQGNKAIDYEKNPDVSGTWYTTGLGIGSSEGSGIGDDNEADYSHIDIINENKLLPFTYSTVQEAYQNPSTSTVANYINSGLSVINYCGHGDHDYWVTSDYSASSVNSSTNGSKLPFVFSVACLVGEFHTGSDCLAEAFLKKSNGGAVAAWMATISQPWQPPMRGQDYANDVLTQGYNYSSNPGNGTSTTYGKTTFGSVTFNAASLMINESSSTDDWDTYKTWTIFGDASLQVRTETPHAVTVSNPTVTSGTYTTQIIVDSQPFENALVSLYKSGDPQPYAALTNSSGNVTITHSLSGSIKLTVTGFNLATYQQTVTVTSPNPPVCDFTADQTTVTAGATVNFTDLSTNSPTSWSWSFTGGTPSSSTAQNPSIVYSTPGIYTVSLTATNGAGSDAETKNAYITVSAITQPPVADFEASQTTVMVGGSVNFTDLSTNQPTSWSWTFDGGSPSSSTAQNPSNIIYSTAGSYTVTLTATNSFGSDTEEKTAYINVVMDYCDAGATDPTDEYISNVTFGDIDNSTSGDGYSDYTNLSTTVDMEQSYPISVTNEVSYSLDQVLVWIDYNIDGDFEDTGELAFTGDEPGTTTQTPYTYSGSITIPATATAGMTRMRVRLHYNSTQYDGNSTPCGDAGYGEVEDYTVIINSSGPVAPVADFQGTPTSVTTGGTVNFTDLSSNSPTSWSWTFSGGTPSSSTAQNPSVLYNTAGTYTVSLTATNAAGSDTETKNGYITVTDPGSDFSLDFEACTDFSSDFSPWTIVVGNTANTYPSSDCNFTGEGTAFGYMAFNPSVAGFSLASAHGGDRCGMAICPADASTADNWLISEQYTFGNNSSISFWVLSPKPGSWGNESYSVLVSTTDNSTGSFTAIATDEEAPDTWTERTYDLSAYDGQSVYIAIRHTSTDMFMFWIDDISITTQQATPPVADFSANTTTVCQGTSISFTNLSSDADTYSWDFSGGAQNSTSENPTVVFDTPGTYTVILTATNNDGSDTESKPDYITVTAPPSLNNITDNVTCNGDTDGSVNLTLTGGTSPFTFNWSNGATTEDVSNLTAGSYTVTVTDNAGCTSSSSATISQPAAISVSASAGDEAYPGACNGFASATASGGTGSFTYSWSSGQTSSIITGLCAGTYTVTVTDANGCTSFQSVNVLSGVGVEEAETGYGISLFPNPNDGRFFLEIRGRHAGETVISVYTISNQLVDLKITKHTDGLWIADMHTLAGGVYFIHVQTGEGVFVRKFVVR